MNYHQDFTDRATTEPEERDWLFWTISALAAIGLVNVLSFIIHLLPR